MPGSALGHDTFLEGRRLQVSHPPCAFRLGRNILHTFLLAGGIGIAPILPMMRSLLLRSRAGIDHRDSFLTEGERAAGQQMCTYVLRVKPTSVRLKLDIAWETLKRPHRTRPPRRKMQSMRPWILSTGFAIYAILTNAVLGQGAAGLFEIF